MPHIIKNKLNKLSQSTLKINLQITREQRKRLNITPNAEFKVCETSEGLLLRPVNPPLTKIYLEPTTICNLKCRTCMRNTWDEVSGEMSFKTYRNLLAGLKKAKTLKTIAYWGFGEPLMHPEIADMINQAKKAGFGTELITNGLLLNRETSEKLIKAGLDTLVVSLDGTSKEALSDIREGADFDTVQANIRYINKIKKTRFLEHPEIGIEFVLMRRNMDELNKLIPLARKMEASFIIITNVLPYTEELKDEIMYELSASGFYSGTRSVIHPEIILPQIDARPEFQKKLAELSSNIVTGRFRHDTKNNTDGYCPFISEGASAVSWDGSVSPCVALMHSYNCYILDREKHIKKYVIGNVNDQSIDLIWNYDEYKSFRKRVQDFDFSPCINCGGCDMAESNEEDCYNQTHPTCGDCLWARGVLQCP